MMRAVVLRSGRLEVDELPDPVPDEGQLLVRPLACGICGSDLHAAQLAAKNPDSAPYAGGVGPRVMGHEFSAEVLAVGPEVTGFSTGDVVVSLAAGGYADRALVSAGASFKVPAGLDPKHAAFTEPMAVGEHAVNLAGVAPGDAALVYGCGPIGLACIASLTRRGIGPVVASDFSPKRREVAEKLGATVVVDPRAEPAIEAWRRVDGSQPLHLFEAVGVPGMIDQAMSDAPRRSRLTVVGACMEPDTIHPLTALGKELSLQFCFAYDFAEVADTLRAIAEGEIDVASLITGSVGLDEVAWAFETLANPGDHVKLLVVP
jgi:threonine dehydrogenase-like Zn-dependent dehydrogenase